MRKIVYIFLFIFFICHVQAYSQLDFKTNKKFTKADTLRGMPSFLRTCYDVINYDLDIKLDIDKKFISGNNTFTCLAINDFMKLQIDLFKNMKIEKIIYNEQELKYSREFNAVFVDFPEIKKSTTFSFKVYYSGNPQIARNPPWDGGLSFDTDDDKNMVVGVSCQGTGASLWWPCKDHQSDEPENMWIRVSVPSEFMDVSNGRLKKETKLDDGYTKYEWYVSYPINNYDVTINVAKYKHFSELYTNPSYTDTLTLDYFVFPANLEKAKKQFVQVKPMMDCYYKLFGEYPFLNDGYKLVETTYLGMEHQTAVAYGNKYKNGYIGYDLSVSGAQFDYIIIHESAHEWWGNSITTNDIADMWIHEGFANYTEALYMECTKGYDSYLKYIVGTKKSIQNDVPIIGIYNVNSEGSGDMYPKGALLLHTIRNIMDDDKKFFASIKGIQDEFKYKIVNSSDIENYISEQSGINFSPVFDQYLRHIQIPTLEIKTKQIGDNLQVQLRWLLEKGNFNKFDMPVKITTTKGELNFVFPTIEWQTIELKNMKESDLKIATDLFYINTLINGQK